MIYVYNLVHQAKADIAHYKHPTTAWYLSQMYTHLNVPDQVLSEIVKKLAMFAARRGYIIGLLYILKSFYLHIDQTILIQIELAIISKDANEDDAIIMLTHAAMYAEFSDFLHWWSSQQALATNAFR